MDWWVKTLAAKSDNPISMLETPTVEGKKTSPISSDLHMHIIAIHPLPLTNNM